MLKTILDNMGDIVAVFDVNGILKFVTPSQQKILGYEPDELIGKNAFEYIHPDDRERVILSFARAIEGGSEMERFRFLDRNGRYIWFDGVARVMRDGEGDVSGVVVGCRDITERLIAEAALSESEERFALVSKAANDAIYDWDLVTNTAWLSPAHQIIFGVTNAHADFVWWSSHIHPDDRDRVVASIHAAMEEGKDTWRDEYRFLRADGRYVDILDRAHIRRTQNGAPVRLVGSMMDITDLKRTQEALQESEKRYRILTENASDIIWTVGLKDMRLTYISPSVTQHLGFTVEEAMARTAEEAYTPESMEKVITMFLEQMAIENAGNVDPARTRMVELELFRKNGTVVPVEGNFSFLRDASGKPTDILAIIRNITERKMVEKSLKAALQEKEILLREIHHRVKNNMQVVSSLLNLQAEKAGNEQARRSLIESRQRIMAMAMIHETLYSGNSLSAIDISTYLKTLVNHLNGFYNEQSMIDIELELEKVELGIDQAVPCGLILNELITNAFKHAFPDGHKGLLRIKVCMAHPRDLVLIVSDNGVGLPPDVDIENSSSLGLRLIHGLLTHQLRGSMTVSTEGGTVFALRWPLPNRILCQSGDNGE
jgi:PAS domain S-box-containing protein